MFISKNENQFFIFLGFPHCKPDDGRAFILLITV